LSKKINHSLFLKTLFLFPALLLLILITNCNKDNGCDLSPNLNVSSTQLQKDIDSLDTYLADSSIVAQVDASGLRFVINDPGSDVTPELCNNVFVTYEGRFLNGDIVDSSDNAIGFPLSSLITGWQLGIPKIGEGGSITLYIPSVYAYGSSGVGPIPPNTNLIFDITLVAVR